MDPADNEQVANNGAGPENENERENSVSNNILCDIIAQQREFQLRQESRSSMGRQQFAKNWRNSIDYSNNQDQPPLLPNNSASSTSTKIANAKHKPRRKFSLSHAMSNLAPFGASSQASGSSTDRQRVPGASFEHRSSLVGGSDQLADPLGAAASGGSQQEKKKSFVHKAIRRGSKLFDSIVLSSAQQQQQQQQASDRDESSGRPRLDGEPEPEAEEAARPDEDDFEEREQQKQLLQLQQLRQRVQFAATATGQQPPPPPPEDNHDHDEFNPEQPHKPHKRRLRLGSFQHDLRRALSLSSNSHHHHHNNNNTNTNHHKSLYTPGKHDSREALAGATGSGPATVANNSATAAAALSQAPLTTGQSNQMPPLHANAGGGLTSTLSLRKPPIESGASSHNKQPNSARLKRKNSLFAPLTSAASSAFYHAHHPSQLVRRRESTVVSGGGGGSGDQATTTATSTTTGGPLAAPPPPPQTNSQSASFSLCQDHSRTYKLIIFGSSAVGKTSIIQRFLYGHFPVAHKPTVEELHSNKYNIPELGEIYLEILDTSGTFEFPAMRRLSIEKGDAFILVFSVDDPSSWQEVVHLRQLILEEKREQRQEELELERRQRQQQQQQLKATAKTTNNNNNKNNSDIGNNNNNNNQIMNNNNNNTRPPSQAVSAAVSSTTEPPISSVYAAAARLASASRRTSSSPGLGAQQRPTAAAAATGSGGQPPAVAAPDQPQLAGGRGQAPVPPVTRSGAHYNSQLSRLLQRTPSQAKERNFLLQSVSIEDGNGDEDADEDEDEEDTLAIAGKNHPPTSLASNLMVNKNNNNNNGGAHNKGSSTDSAGSSSGSIAAKSGEKDNDHQSATCTGGDRPPQPPPTRRRTPIVVVANKCDLDSKSSTCQQLDQDEIERLVCDQWRNSFVRCSAKEALNIDRVFKELLRQARAPEILSQFVIDDHQQRRQSLPVLKNQLSAHHVKGLRSLYNQQQLQNSHTTNSKMNNNLNNNNNNNNNSSSSGSGSIQQQEPRPISSTSATGNDDSQCAIM